MSSSVSPTLLTCPIAIIARLTDKLSKSSEKCLVAPRSAIVADLISGIAALASRASMEEKLPLVHPEDQYLALLRTLLHRGVAREDRTGVGTLSIFGHQLRFDLSEGFPLLTTKRIYFKGCAHELLWFLSGDT